MNIVVKKIITWTIVIALIGGFIWLFIPSDRDNINGNFAYVGKEVHWHTDVEVYLCGEKRDFPRTGVGEHFKGLPLLHTHDDNRIHVEGYVKNEGDVLLGKFFDAIKVPFDNETIYEYKNGGMCNDGKENKARMLVNGQESFEFRSHVIKDGDRLIVRYE